MSKPIIAVDCDDTILDENTAIRLYMNATHGYTHTAEDYNVIGEFIGYWEAIWPVGKEQTAKYYDEFTKSPAKVNLNPLPGALETLRWLKERYDLAIVTSRDNGGDFEGLTHAQLARHYPDVFDERDVHFVSLWSSADGKKVTKAKICQEIGASYLIDDSFEHCEFAAEAGLQAILFGGYGWNRERELIPGMSRVRNWQEVRGYFDGLAGR